MIQDHNDILSILGPNPTHEQLEAHALTLGDRVIPVEPNTHYDFVVMLNDMQNNEVFDQFHTDMTSSTGVAFIPERPIECSNFRPLSAGTEYRITVEEAVEIAKDPRVAYIDRTFESKGISLRPFVSQTSSEWDKGSTATSTMKNWGLLRSTNRGPIPDWGSDAIPANRTQNATITLPNYGQDVDVVIADGHIDPTHPEFAVNPDGTGGSRVVQFNWFSLNEAVLGTSATVYNYNLTSTNTSTQIEIYSNNNHGHHVAGIVAGNTNGWARAANIYNIYPYDSSVVSSANIFAYIRAWHAQKDVNPITGRKNPTIVNCSFGGSSQDFGNTIDTVYDRGTTVNQADLPTPPDQTPLQASYNGNWDTDTLSNLRVRLYSGYVSQYGVALALSQSYDASLAADVLDAANEGIITVGAAGNSWGLPCYVLEHPEYDNYYETSFLGIFHNFFRRYANRGPWPSASQRGTASTATDYEAALCIGNLSSTIDERSSFTSCVGDRVDVFAPGEHIMSSISNDTLEPWFVQAGVQDPRDAAYYLEKLTGTSMASPQVAGVVATIIGDQPWLTMKQMREHIIANADSGNMWEPTSPAFQDDYQLRGAANKILNYSISPYAGTTSTNTGTTSTNTSTDIRLLVGNVYPPLLHGTRPTSGQTYPRSRIRRS